MGRYVCREKLKKRERWEDTRGGASYVHVLVTELSAATDCKVWFHVRMVCLCLSL